MDDLERRTHGPVPTRERPLLGLTVLLVEDSRFASDAIRLLCLRSGARIRRADSLAAARRHLQVYRPSVLLVDLGLPDGDGTTLIADLAAARPRVGVLLATSGDDLLRDDALEAGADGFLPKPIDSLMAFQDAILRHLPPECHPPGPREVLSDRVRPDLIAYRDDMAQIAGILDGGGEEEVVDYVRHFLQGVARSAEDEPLLRAVQELARARRDGRAITPDLARVAGLVQARLAQPMAI